jgi:hypothetical protein
MNKKFYILVLISLMVASSLACQAVSIGGVNLGSTRGSGTVVEENRPISGVKTVEVANQGNLIIQIGVEESLVIEAEDNLMDSITSDVRSGRLTLGTKSGVNLRNTEPINYYLTVPGLQGLSVSSSGDIDAPALEAERFEIRVSSSGDINIEELIARQLEVDITSSGDVTINAGVVEDQDVRISSSGNYDASRVDSRQVKVRLSSSGDAVVRVEEQLDATLSSSGNLYYIGDPQVAARVTSSGDVIQR